MNKLFKSLSFLAVISLLIAAWSVQADASKPVPAQPAAQNVSSAAIPVTGMSYEALLNKSSTDQAVADFITRSNCSNIEQFQICRSAGVALGMDADQNVQTVFLYPGLADGFAPYQGQLPFGLAFTDTMESVERKLGQPVDVHAPQAGWAPGLPDEGMTLDHIHYEAIYSRLGLVVVYNSPSGTDKNATIHSILVSE